MNEFYRLLVYFHKGEKIARSFLLRKSSITAELIDRAILLNYIVEIDSSPYGDVRYIITEKGIKKRDN